MMSITNGCEERSFFQESLSSFPTEIERHGRIVVLGMFRYRRYVHYALSGIKNMLKQNQFERMVNK